MAMFTLSFLIERPQQEVFDLLSNPGNIHPWPPLTPSAARAFNGALGVSSTGRGIRKTLGQDTELQIEVTRWDSPNRYEIKVLNAEFPFEVMRYGYTLEPEGCGTRVTLDCESEWVRLY